MEDILLAFHRCSELPEFVASDLSRLPPLNMHNIDFAHLLHEYQGMRAEMTKLRDEVQLFKATPHVPQRDGPWSKSNNVASAVNNLPLVVNLPAVPKEKSAKAAPPKINARKLRNGYMQSSLPKRMNLNRSTTNNKTKVARMVSPV